MTDPGNQWFRFLLSAACLLAALSVQATEVFRWTDDSGQVHYGQRPPPGGADSIELPQRGSGVPVADDDMVQRRERQDRLLEAYEYERARKRARQATEEQQRAEDATRCARLQRYWRQLSFPAPLYLTGADGSRDYLSDEQRVSEKARVRPFYVQACGKEP